MSEGKTVICKVGDIAEGSMKEVAVGDQKVLVVNDKGKFYASGHKCTHYGAQLVNGALNGTRVRCPWHGACFNIATGDIEDYPGTDALASFGVQIEGDNVVLQATAADVAAAQGKRSRAPCKSEKSSTFVVIGGGPAGAAAVEAIRDSGYKGKLILINKENVAPYDRAKLSKMLNAKIEQVQLRSTAYYAETLDVELRLGQEVTALNAVAKTITVNGETIKYDAALIATGGNPIRLPLGGAEKASNAYTLRSIADANLIDSKLAGSDVVVFGSSFIGMEIAANAVAKAKSVTVIARSDLPFKQSLGSEIGAAFLKLHEKQKVRFMKNASVKETHQEGDRVVALTLSTGEKIPVDVVVFGVGVEVSTSTSFVSGVKLDRDGSIFCDESLLVADGLYVAGDVARFPDPKKEGHFLRIEHWGVAQNMGKVAGRNMAAGKAVAKFDHVPFFWTMQFGKGLRYCGHAPSYDEIIFDKEPNGLEADSLKFVAFYVKDCNVVAAASVGRDPVVSKVAEMMHAGHILSAVAVKEAIAGGKLLQLLS
eukprot:TRINITY_DN10620_c0_g1_i1.p1 TRINITY_DN10620_c0_g1~~TRINITY_DN10620_c0_g1_i1.p1  ORF type:complete len:553 (+),score=111.30 TRINITY_DN10620_c0_g1_i1:47-1660(+)